MRVREQRDDLARRVAVLVVGLNVVLGIVLMGFWYVQVVQGAEYRRLAENNRLRQQPIKAPRGLIHDRNGQTLVENSPSYNLLFDRSRTEDPAASLAFAGDVLELAPEVLADRLDSFRSVPLYRPVRLAENLSLGQVTRFGVFRLEHPEFEVEIGHLRTYRYGEATAHVLGYLGEATPKDIERLDGRVVEGDLVGRRGIEQTYDLVLRGEDGERVQVVDSRGKPLEEYQKDPAVPGTDLDLTLDLGLQLEAARLLEGRPGSVVALDPRDGAIRALVSSPSFDPNLFNRRLDPEVWKAIVDHPRHPLQNRPVQSSYSPGSLFKIVMGVEGLSSGMVRENERVYCSGSTMLYNHRFRCWSQGGHGWVDLAKAIKVSCDVYFYHLGQKLGIDRIAPAARRFGMGQRSGIRLDGERSGLVPDRAWSLRRKGEPWYPGETISVAIGQGPLLATPLQMASLMATVANRGRSITPHLVGGQHPSPPEPVEGLDLDALETVRRSLVEVVNSRDGTGRSAALPDIVVAGKTGTVQVVRQKTWTTNKELPPEHRDHAWFASFAPAEQPELVVVVLVEHAGAGSEQAAPIARKLYERYFHGTEPAQSSDR